MNASTKKNAPKVVGVIVGPSNTGRMTMNVYSYHGDADRWAVTRERGSKYERGFCVTASAYSAEIHGRAISGHIEYSIHDATRLACWLAQHPFWSKFDEHSKPSKDQLLELNRACHTASIGRSPITEMIQPVSIRSSRDPGDYPDPEDADPAHENC